MTISFFVRGTPKAQPRPRAFARNMGGGKFAARVYDAGTAEGWKSLIALEAKPYLLTIPIESPLSVTLNFYIARPKSHMGKNGVKASAPIHPTGKPDLDNAAKAVLDCLTQIGMWGDDAQVVRLTLTKAYADYEDLGREGCSIRITDEI